MVLYLLKLPYETYVEAPISGTPAWLLHSRILPVIFMMTSRAMGLFDWWVRVLQCYFVVMCWGLLPLCQNPVMFYNDGASGVLNDSVHTTKCITLLSQGNTVLESSSYCISGNFYVWKIIHLKIMRNQFFAIINTRKINNTLKYKLRYTINNTKVSTCR